MLKKISIIHPTRNRSELAFAAFKRWLPVKTPFEYLLSVDIDDTSVYHWANPIVSPNRSIVDAVNNAAAKATGDILIVISDDFFCFPDWDIAILEASKNCKNWIMKTDDLSDNGLIQQPWIITLPLMDREFYQKAGYIYHPSYFHMFCDTDQTHRAALLDSIIDARYLRFAHNHHASGLNPKDAISERADASFDEGAKIYIDRYLRNFDLPKIMKLPPYKDIAQHASFMASRYKLAIDFQI